MRQLFVVGVLGLLMSCEGRKSLAEKQASPYSLPTAVEAFELRSKCAALGEKLLEANIIGSALTQEQVTHYNPQTNRCYVKLEVHSADLTTRREKFVDHLYLYDGQTHEMLVAASAEGSRKWAYVLDGFEAAKPDHPTGVLANHDDATALIEKYMADARKQ